MADRKSAGIGAVISRFHYQFDGVAYPPGKEIPASVYEKHQPKLVSDSPGAPEQDAPGEDGLLADLTVPELKERAKAAGVEGYSAMVKADLVEALSGEGRRTGQ